MNRYTATGRLTRDPQLRTLPSGNQVCEMRLAVDGMGAKRSTGYIDVTTFGKAAEAAAKVLGQGWLVAVDGRIEHSTWKDRDGNSHQAYSVIGHVEFLRAPRAASDTDGNQPAEGAADAGPVTDDIPL